MDPDLYRRRQRRRAAIGWTALVAVVALVVVVVLAGGGGDGGTERPQDLQFLSVSAEMSANDYESIREGEEEAVLVGRIGSGLRENDVEQGLLGLFQAEPGGSHCAFWTLSDAPGHLVRLCFQDGRDVLLQKSVAAKGENAPPQTLT